MIVERMRDSDDADAIPVTWTGVVGGYLHVGDPAGPWTRADWDRFPRNRKLPIVERSNPNQSDPVADAFAALGELYSLGVPKGVHTALAIETARAPSYVTAYGKVMAWAGYKVWVYGSASTLFSNPALDGRWVADYKDTGPFMYPDSSVRATQYANPSTGSGGHWDSSSVRWWQYHMTRWWL